MTGRPPGTQARCRCGTVFALPEPTKTAGQLSCPGCGANVPPTDHNCSFCSAVLKVKACPRCFAQVFQCSKHCNHCGTKVARPAEATVDGEARVRSCPRCEVNLEARIVSEVLLDECPDCHGVFLDACAVESVVRERRQATASQIISMATPEISKEQAEKPGRLYIKCPDCDQVMNRVNFGRRSGIIVDVCKPHGTWFDRDELPRVVEFVMSGGLEASVRKDAQLMRDEARRARNEARASAEMATVGHGFSRRPTGAHMLGGLLGSIGSLLID